MIEPKLNGKKFKLIVLLIAVLVAVGGSQIPKHIFITLTPSIKYRVLWLTADLDNISVGDYVVFRLNKERLQGLPLPTELADDDDGIILAVKRVGCVEGDVLLRKGDGGRDFYCGDQFLGHAKDKSRKGVPLDPARIQGTIPEGKAYVTGDNVDSFDSRYFGLVSKNTFVYRAIGIF